MTVSAIVDTTDMSPDQISKHQKDDLRRTRNRAHARKTRGRKKERIESLQQTYLSLKVSNDDLRTILKKKRSSLMLEKDAINIGIHEGRVAAASVSEGGGGVFLCVKPYVSYGDRLKARRGRKNWNEMKVVRYNESADDQGNRRRRAKDDRARVRFSESRKQKEERREARRERKEWREQRRETRRNRKLEEGEEDDDDDGDSISDDHKNGLVIPPTPTSNAVNTRSRPGPRPGPVKIPHTRIPTLKNSESSSSSSSDSDYYDYGFGFQAHDTDTGSDLEGIFSLEITTVLTSSSSDIVRVSASSVDTTESIDSKLNLELIGDDGIEGDFIGDDNADDNADADVKVGIKRERDYYGDNDSDGDRDDVGDGGEHDGEHDEYNDNDYPTKPTAPTSTSASTAMLSITHSSSTGKPSKKSNRSAPIPANLTPLQTTRLLMRRERNKHHANATRERKKNYTQMLENLNDTLTKENSRMRTWIVKFCGGQVLDAYDFSKARDSMGSRCIENYGDADETQHQPQQQQQQPQQQQQQQQHYLPSAQHIPRQYEYNPDQKSHASTPNTLGSMLAMGYPANMPSQFPNPNPTANNYGGYNLNFADASQMAQLEQFRAKLQAGATASEISSGNSSGSGSGSGGGVSGLAVPGFHNSFMGGMMGVGGLPFQGFQQQQKQPQQQHYQAFFYQQQLQQQMLQQQQVQHSLLHQHHQLAKQGSGSGAGTGASVNAVESSSSSPSSSSQQQPWTVGASQLAQMKMLQQQQRLHKEQLAQQAQQQQQNANVQYYTQQAQLQQNAAAKAGLASQHQAAGKVKVKERSGSEDSNGDAKGGAK